MSSPRLDLTDTEKGWSQDELSIASGLHDLDPVEKPTVKKYEYKTVEMPFRFGIVKRGLPDFEKILSAEGDKGWRLLQIFSPAGPTGESEQMVAVFEREKTA